MQNVSFDSLEEFFDFLPDEEYELVRYLRAIILDCMPNCKEKLSFNVPFFKRRANVCFLWPASVLWGKKKTYEGVRLGFSKGYLLHDDIQYLEKGNRKQVYWRDFKSKAEVDIDILRAYIYDAIRVDDEHAAKKKKK